MKKALLFEININSSNNLVVNEVDASKINPLTDNIQCIESFTLNEFAYLLTFEKDSGTIDIYQTIDNNGIYMNALTKNKVPFNASLLAIMYANTIPICIAYDQSSGQITFLEIQPDLTLLPFNTLNAGQGITTLKTFSSKGDWFVLAYNMSTGAVSKNQILISTTTPLTLSLKNVWTSLWAQSWTRFSFFQIGAENFFIKTNLTKSKVNIDLFINDPNEGSHLVLNSKAPSQMIGLNNVNAFTDSNGFPYFATYRNNGE